MTARDDLAEVLAPHAIGDPFILVDALNEHRGEVLAFFDEVTETAMTELDIAHAVNEPKPTAIPIEDRCPHCGGEPPDMDDHRDSCPTLGTCAQCHPETPRPWHTEGEWWPDGIKFSDALAAHMREAHKS